MDKEIIRYYHINGIVFTEDGGPSQFPAHWHTAAEFTAIKGEGCKYKISDMIYTPEPGDILLSWPRELHETISAPENAASFVQFSSAIIESNTDLTAAMSFLGTCHHISAKKEPALAKRLYELIFRIGDTYNGIGVTTDFFLETKCKQIVYEILILIGEYVMREHKEEIGTERFSDKSFGYIRSACSYISEHASDNITQAEVAAVTGLSPYYFSKLFNEYTHTTFPAYLATIRVKNAINLLANEQMSITDCAFAAGFQSTTTFNKIFLEHTGCSPRDYRKLLNSNK